MKGNVAWDIHMYDLVLSTERNRIIQPCWRRRWRRMRFKEKNLSSFEDQWSILESFHLLLAIWMALGIGQSLLFPLFQLQDVKPGLFRLNHFPFHKFEAVPTCCPEGVLFPPAIYWSSGTFACFMHNCIRRIQHCCRPRLFISHFKLPWSL